MPISHSGGEPPIPREGPPGIVLLTAPSRFGGLETSVLQLATGLARRGHDVRVCCRLEEEANADDHPFVASLRRENVPVDVIQLPHRAYLRECSTFCELLRDRGADVVHTHGYHADVVGAWAARRVGVPRVATAHGFTRGGWKNRLYEVLQRRSYRSAEAVIAVSRSLADELAGDPAVGSAIRHLHNAWVRRADHLDRGAARAALGLESAGFVAGWIGRMSDEKGPDVMVEAMRDVSAAGVTACMVGDGPLRDELQAGPAPGQEGRVLWPGVVEDAGRLLRAFDVVVLSSRTEGSPMVLLEAMDAGVPIVATRVGGIPDMVSSEEALLVPSDDPAALREAVLAVRRDPEGASERARRAAARLEDDFTAAAWLDAHEAIYRDAVARHAGSDWERGCP